MLKRYLFLMMIVCLFAISTVSAEEICNETISQDSSLMTDSVSEYNLSISLTDNEIQGSTDNGTFTDLQKKINNADVGSTITLENDYEYNSGFSTEGISINKTLTINGNGHVIDALGQSRIFFINSTKVTLNNILFKNANTTDNGGAICWYGDNGEVNNCNFTNNIASQRGGAIYWYGVNGTINNSNFINNTGIKFGGGAIYWDSDSSNGEVNNCNFINNMATQKGGAIYWYGVNGKMTDCNFTNNTSINGGVIFWDNNALNGTVDNSNFINNTGNDGGAIYWYGAYGKMTNSNFTNNRGTNGGAINWQRTYGLINNCNFINNAATNGGAIYWEGTNGTENNCNFTNNTAELNGGAIYWLGSNGTVLDSNFINNNATTNGGAIYFNDAACINNCALVNNIAPTASEIYISGDTTNLNYNWWGSNDPDWANLINGSYVLSVFAVLNVTANPSEISTSEKSNITTKFVWNGTNTDATNLLPKRNVELTSNGNLTETEGYVGLNSQFSANTGGIYYVNATADNEILGGNINVSVAPKKNLNISASAEPITVGENVTIVVNGFENATGNVTARLQGGIYSAPIVNGTVTFTVPGLTSSTTAYINYAGDANYNNASTTVNITVNPKSDIIVLADNVTKYYRGPEMFGVRVMDVHGFPIVGESVNITINGVTYTRVTSGIGTAGINLNLNSGIYGVTVVVDNITVNSLVTILTTVNGTDVVKMYRNATQYYATFIDTTGKYLADGTDVKFNINGIEYTRKIIGGKGQAGLNINLPPGEYIITAINSVTGEMHSNNITVLPVLTAEDLKMKYLDGNQFKANLLDGQGKPYANQFVTFNVNGILYNRLTDSNGQAALNIRLIPGEYIITSSFNGCNIANKITITS